MNKQFLCISLLLVIIPACNRKPQVPVAVTTPVPEYYAPTIAQPGAPTVIPSEEISAFVLQEEANPFNSMPASPDYKPLNEDAAVVKAEEASIPDRYKDSVQYGFKKVYFKYNQHSIDPEQLPTLEHNLEIAKSLVDKGYTLVIEGHACNSAGSDSYNMILSERRAVSIKNYFIDNGISRDAIKIKGCGCLFPDVAHGDRQAQAPNRRAVPYAHAPQS